MPEQFASLRERLLRAGVRPGTANRYVGELRDHLDDMIAELETKGLARAAAQEAALSRLGSIDALAAPMISDRRFHSWTARVPWAVFLFAPILGYAAVVATLAFALASATSPGAVPDWFDMASRTARHVAGSVVPLAAAWLLAFTALRQRSRAMWPLLGMGFTIVVASMVELQIQLPAVDQDGTISLALTAPSATQVATLLIAAAAPLFLLRWVRRDGSNVQVHQ